MKQNIDWLEKAIRSSSECPAMPARRRADLIFSPLEGLMAFSLTMGEDAATFREKAVPALQSLLNSGQAQESTLPALSFSL